MDMFKVENKEYAISGSSVACRKCGEYLAKFEVAVLGDVCSPCYYSQRVAPDKKVNQKER